MKPTTSLFFQSATMQILNYSLSSSQTTLSNLKISKLSPNSKIRFGIKNEIEIRVCVNRTCNQSGSRGILQILSDIAPTHVSIKSCGCLGRCGAGPNLVALPEGLIIGHCGTAAKAANVLAALIGEEFDPKRNLEALNLRKKGETEMEKGNFSAAEDLITKAIDLNPSGGLHIMYKSRSTARLAMSKYSGALEDAKEASRISPAYSQAFICLGDAFLAMENYESAEESYATALQTDPSIHRSKSFKLRIAKLREKVAKVSVSA